MAVQNLASDNATGISAPRGSLVHSNTLASNSATGLSFAGFADAGHASNLIRPNGVTVSGGRQLAPSQRNGGNTICP